MKSALFALFLSLALTLCSSKCLQNVFTFQNIFNPSRSRGAPRLEKIVCSNISADVELEYNYEVQPFKQELKIERSLIPKLRSNSSLSKFTNISSLEVAGVGVEEVESGAFTGLVALRQLVLSDNKISVIPAEVFSNLKTLEVLLLTNNRIARIQDKSFTGLEKLAVLYLDRNQLVTLQANVFNELKSLEELTISENPLVEFSPSNFSSLKAIVATSTSLKSLDINFTRSLNMADFSKSQLGEFNFAKLSPQRLLQLERNHLTSVSNWEDLDCDRVLLDHNRLPSFQVPENVIELRLSHNLITIFEMPRRDTKLRELDLSFNKITKIEALRGFPELEVLDLRHNEIVILKEEIFGGSPRLRKLYLANNRIDAIEGGAFEGLSNLDHLDISGNNLKEIKSPVLSELRITTVVVGNTVIEWEYVKYLISHCEDLALQLDQEFWSCKDTNSEKIKYVTKYNVGNVTCHFSTNKSE